MGCLGVLSSVTLALVPDYDVSQRVYGQMPPSDEGGVWPASALLQNWEELLESCDRCTRTVLRRCLSRTRLRDTRPLPPRTFCRRVPVSSLTCIEEF